MNLCNKLLSLILIFYFNTIIFSQETINENLLVSTPQGKYKGIYENNAYVWKGIRYAKPCVGELRFKNPQPIDSFDSIAEVTKFGPMAPQQKSKKWVKIMNEDCLYLNIWKPNTNTNKRPVMVWIYGGGFYTGSSSLPIYNGSDLANKGDVIVVTFNYRLGALGFLYFDEIKKNQQGFDNNLGIKDQVAALKWVKENIEYFGGDPNNITIFGQSAGATSVLTLMNVPATEGLFHKAIAQSPAIHQNWTKEEATAFTRNFLKLFSIDENNLSDLYKIPVDSFVKVGNNVVEKVLFPVPGIGTYAPTIDGEFLPTMYHDSTARLNSRNIPLIIGTNKHEMNMLYKVPIMPFNADESDVHKVFATTNCPDDEKRIISFYEKYPSKQTVLNICTDRVFRIPSICLADDHCNIASTYMYRFDWYSMPLNLAGYKAAHALDLFFVFNTFNTVHGKKVTTLANMKKARKISEKMQHAWINFAHTGNPNDIGSKEWEPYNNTTRPTMVFNKKTKLKYDPDRKFRQAWGGIELK